MPDQPAYLIYIVDPDEAIRDGVETLLSSFNVSVHGFPDAGSFFSQLAEIVPSCVLIENQLPDKNGLSVLKSLRSQGYLMPVLMITSSKDSAYAQEVRRFGKAEVLTKPLINNDFITYIQSVLVPDVTRSRTHHFGAAGDPT